MRTLYEKYVAGTPITDAELSQGIEYFLLLTQQLDALGPVFRLAANESRRVLQGLQSFNQARINAAYGAAR